MVLASSGGARAHIARGQARVAVPEGKLAEPRPLVVRRIVRNELLATGDGGPLVHVHATLNDNVEFVTVVALVEDLHASSEVLDIHEQ